MKVILPTFLSPFSVLIKTLSLLVVVCIISSCLPYSEDGAKKDEDNTQNDNTNTGNSPSNDDSENTTFSLDNLYFEIKEDEQYEGVFNFSNPNQLHLTFSIEQHPSVGSVQILDSSIGMFLYTPNTDISGDDSFSISCSDSVKVRNAQIFIKIIPENDPPVASNGSITVNIGETYTGSL